MPKLFKHLVYILNRIWVNFSKKLCCFFDDELFDFLLLIFTLLFKFLIVKVLLKLVAISDHYLLNLFFDFVKRVFIMKQNEFVRFTVRLNPLFEFLARLSPDLVSLCLLFIFKFHNIDYILLSKIIMYIHKFGDLLNYLENDPVVLFFNPGESTDLLVVLECKGKAFM